MVVPQQQYRWCLYKLWLQWISQHNANSGLLCLAIIVYDHYPCKHTCVGVFMGSSKIYVCFFTSVQYVHRCGMHCMVVLKVVGICPSPLLYSCFLWKFIKPMYIYCIISMLGYTARPLLCLRYLSPYFQLTQNMKEVHVCSSINCFHAAACNTYTYVVHIRKKSNLDDSLSCSSLLVGTSALIVFD